MKLKPDDGGPAFPCEDWPDGGDPGMTLRDYFAGQALAPLMDRAGKFADVGNPVLNGGKRAEDLARACYEMADALLAERAKEKDL